MRIMAEAPQVSVLMPSLNQHEFIEVAVRSVFERSAAAVELLIVDGGSSDGTLGLLEKFLDEFSPRLRWASAPDNGPASAFNKALRMARGDIIGWLNADDIYALDAIGAAVRRFTRDGDLVMLYGEAEYVDATGRSLDRYPTKMPSQGIEAFRGGCFICQPTVFLRRCVFEKLGMLDEELSTAFDFDLWLRIFRHFPQRIGYIDRVQAFSRVHGRTITSLQRKAVASEAARLLARYLGSAEPHWILTYVNEIARAYPSYDLTLDLRGHVSALISELASCFDPLALARLRSSLDLDRRLTVVPAGVHAEMFPDGWAGRELAIRIRAPFRGTFSLLLECEHGNPANTPLELTIKTNCGPEMSSKIECRGQFEVAIPIPDVLAGQLLFVSVHSSCTFIPSVEDDASTDSRQLAFRITRIMLLELTRESSVPAR
jgi:glycosyltransferase involved in cell wall biosynthesis